MNLDPIDYAVISQALIAAAREAGAKLVRSAYSTVLREARDGSAAILDRDGNTVVQAELIPMMLGSIGAVFRACSERYPVETLRPGDFFAINDPYSGGQHLQDVFFFHPIFFEDEVVGFSASCAHHLDLGGGSPGLSPHARDVHSEGLILPPLKCNMDRDWGSGPLYTILQANVRVPSQTMGDFEAQMAANQIGIGRVRELCGRYGAAKVMAVMAELQNYSERRTRAGIAAAPDGVYYGEAFVDDDGISDEPVRVCSTVTIRGDYIEVDFSGTSAQVATNINAPLASTLSAALSCIKSVLTSADIPFNAGAARPVTVKVPKGSLLNPNRPAPVRARMLACFRAYNATMKALAQAVPHQVIACGFDTTTVACLSWPKDGGYSVCLEILGGGYGAAIDADGCHAVDSPLGNCSNTPVEAIDQDLEFFRIAEYSPIPDSFGHGKHRGGAGFRRVYEVLRGGAQVALYSDHFRLPPEGLAGGTEALGGACDILRKGKTIGLRSKDTAPLEVGDLVVFTLGGGGGYGDPRERSPEAVADDMIDGLLSLEAAQRHYPGRA